MFEWAVIGLVFGAFTEIGFAAEQKVMPEDSGYFLSFRQKGQLIWSGRVRDSEGRWYNIWICPGYTNPSDYSWKHIKKGGRAFREYVGVGKYKDLADASGDCFEWAFEDCIYDFVLKGVPRAWGRYMANAADRTGRRVFGSILAYPWAVMEGTVDTIVRVGAGLCGMALGITAGTALVPSWYMVNSAVEGTLELTCLGILLPVSGYAWNTVVSPPLAFLGGPRPIPSRVDGFWVRLEGADTSSSVLSTEEAAAAVAWGKVLLREIQPYYDQMNEVSRQTREEMKRLNRESASKQKEIRAEAKKRVEQLRGTAAAQFTASHVPSRTVNQFMNRHRSEIDAALMADSDISSRDRNRILQLLWKYPPAAIMPMISVPSETTDPVRRSIEIIQDMDK